MTTYTNCAPTDPLQQHETYRLTITPASGFLTALIPNTTLSDTLNAALTNIFASGEIDGATTFVQALNSNPYQPGDLAETVDFLVTSNGGELSDFLSALLGTANDFSLWSSTDWSSVVVAKCERVVGTNAAPIGSPAADAAVNSPQAAATRAQESASASVAQLNSQGNSWLATLENDVGKIGTIAALTLAAVVVYGVYKRVRGRANA